MKHTKTQPVSPNAKGPVIFRPLVQPRSNSVLNSPQQQVFLLATTQVSLTATGRKLKFQELNFNCFCRSRVEVSVATR
jgi:hypothetical protein